MLPSVWFEGLPLVVLEALAAGTPCVAFDVPSLRTVVEPCWGHLIALGDYEGLVAAGVAACLEPDARWLERSRAARERYEATYTDEHNARSLLDAYESAIRMRGGR
jgi:glycosyltransferase involved in cell wall biosynthesis